MRAVRAVDEASKGEKRELDGCVATKMELVAIQGVLLAARLQQCEGVRKSSKGEVVSTPVYRSEGGAITRSWQPKGKNLERWLVRHMARYFSLKCGSKAPSKRVS